MNKEVEKRALKDFVNIDFYIAGVKFHQYEDIKDEIAFDDELILERDPTNKFDKYAVKILYEDKMLGFVPAKTGASVIVARALDSGTDLVTTVVENNVDKEYWKALKVWIRNKDRGR